MGLCWKVGRMIGYGNISIPDDEHHLLSVLQNRHNIDKIKDQQKQYRESHKAERSVSKRIWEANNKERRRAQGKLYRENNKDAINARHKQWRDANKEELNKRDREYRKAHPKDRTIYLKQYREEHKQELAEKAKAKREAKIAAGYRRLTVDGKKKWVYVGKEA